jgi:hypothetical protein
MKPSQPAARAFSSLVFIACVASATMGIRASRRSARTETVEPRTPQVHENQGRPLEQSDGHPAAPAATRTPNRDG